MEFEVKPRMSVIDGDFIPFYVCYNKKGEELKTLDKCIEICDDFIDNINKANRKYTDTPPYTMEVREHLVRSHSFIWQEGYEADDLVISFKAQRTEYDCTIVSPDKDILNLTGTHFNPRKMESVTTTISGAEEFFWKSMIIGDSIDGIRGIPGKGKIAADKIFEGIKCPPARILKNYIEHFGEYEGIKEFTKNYLSLKLIDNVTLNEIKVNKVNKEVCE